MKSSRGIKRSSELGRSGGLRKSAELRSSGGWMKKSVELRKDNNVNNNNNNNNGLDGRSPSAAPPNFLPYEFTKTYPQMQQSPVRNRSRNNTPKMPSPKLSSSPSPHRSPKSSSPKLASRLSHFELPMMEDNTVWTNKGSYSKGKQSRAKALLISLFPCMVDENDWRFKPSNFFFSLTFVITLMQIIIFGACIIVGGIAPLSVNFNVGPHITTLIQFGAKVAWLIKYKQQLFRFISPLFLHAGFIHLFINLFAQTRFGTMCEKEWGKRKYLAIYFGTGIGSILTSCLLQPNEISVGASGSICGLVGAYFAQVILLWKMINKKERKAQVFQMFLFLLIIGLMALSPYIDSSAHLGGFVMGLVFGFGLLADAHSPVVKKLRWFFLTLVVVYFVVGFWYFFAHITPVYYNLYGLY